MATSKVEVTFKPDAKSALQDLKNHIELVDALLDVTVTDASDVALEFGVDYDDDEKPVATSSWTI